MENDREFRISADSKGRQLEGGRFYCISLPALIPDCDFWSVIVYNSHSNIMIHTTQSWPSVYSSQKGLLVNSDGSVDIWFGPEARSGDQRNFIKTIPGDNWFMIFRLYHLAESVNDEWKPGMITEVGIDSE